MRRIAHEPGPDENLQVLRHGGLGKVQPGHYLLAAAGVGGAELPQDLQPRRMGKRGKPRRQRVPGAAAILPDHGEIVIHRSSTISDG